MANQYLRIPTGEGTSGITIAITMPEEPVDPAELEALGIPSDQAAVSGFEDLGNNADQRLSTVIQALGPEALEKLDVTICMIAAQCRQTMQKQRPTRPA
ncbi:MAG: hypothetical protein HC837_04785 [Chloroflexaceae bacterium]|nr:hypothetical protein [Chloroflexaceae bacterium]